jgi:hypothetical protein
MLLEYFLDVFYYHFLNILNMTSKMFCSEGILVAFYVF